MQIIFKDTGKIRIDKWLAYKFPEHSREFFNNNIKKGMILINNQLVKSAEKLNIDDIIDINDLIFTSPIDSLRPNKKIKLKIVFENNDFAIIDKPAGLLVQPLNFEATDTLANALINQWPKIKNVGEDPLRPGIVHRLDKDTSGLMIIPKTNTAFKSFKLKFQNHTCQKVYTALIYGHLKYKKGVINQSIARSKNKFNRRKITLNPDDGKEAITEYEVVKEYSQATLVKVIPKTGRTHQIRVHFAAMSNFVIGDMEYGSKKINDQYRLERQFLHAGELSFVYKKNKYHFISKLPSDLRKILTMIGGLTN